MVDGHVGARAAAARVVAADLQYLYPAMTRELDRFLVLQYCSLIAYETRRFHRLQIGVPLETPESGAMVEAGRHSVKYLGDERRPIDEAVAQFGAVIAANRVAFFPLDRDRRYDWLRTDLSVVTIAGVPMLSSVSNYFGLGLGSRPATAAAFEEVGPIARQVGWEVGDLVRELLPEHDRHHEGPRPVNPLAVLWLDGDSEKAYPSMFGGVMAVAEAGLLSAIAFGLAAADCYAHSSCCPECAGAAFKYRLTLLWHAAASLRRLASGPFSITAQGRARLNELCAAAELRPARGPNLRRLRNGLVHLGLSDLPKSALAGAPGVQQLTEAYTGMSFERVEHEVDLALHLLSETLTTWSLQAPPSGVPYLHDFAPPDE